MKKFVSLLLTILLAITMLMHVSVFGEVDTESLNSAMLTSINQLRASVGQGPLVTDTQLITIANVRAQEASVKWSHTRPDGTQGADMIPANKWRGENLSYITGTEDVSEASKIMFDNLVASPTHYDNMVFGEFTKIGISSYVENGKITVAYMFSS